MSETLDAWIARQLEASARGMLRSVSPVDLVKERPGFGQTVRAAHGAVVASPVLADWDPDPDYFFHWYRDSALVMDALRQLHEDGVVGDEALAHRRDFVRFSLALMSLDGGAVDQAARHRVTRASFQQYLRDASELAHVRGDAVLADTRVNADGTLDFTKWTRPQHDGAPLRALALLRWARHAPLDAEAQTLLRADLAFTQRHAEQPSFDIWEEESGWHYYTLRVSAAALAEGDTAQCVQSEALLRRLDDYWLEDRGYYRSRVLASGERSGKELDIAVILAAIHARAASGPHGSGDPRLLATLDRLDAHFAQHYAINRDRCDGPALGRYPGDIYHGGNPWFIATLSAAEFCYRTGNVGRGDAYVSTVRAFTPDDGALSEQFDRDTGAPVSARHLAWSYAAFITCASARRTALR